VSAWCRACGCTDERACSEGCSWAEPDLCSSCAAKALAAHPLILAPLGVELTMHGWLAVHGNLLLALRHPGNDGSSRELVEDLVSTLEGAFLDAGLLSEAQLEMIHGQQAGERAAQASNGGPLIVIPGA